MLAFIQITDTHVLGDRDELEGTRPTQILDQAVRDIRDRYPDAAFVVHSGDIGGMEGRAQDYERYRSLIRHLPIPVYAVRGNHDQDSGAFRRVLLSNNAVQNELCWSFEKEGRVFVGLDSSAGKLGGDQQKWLRSILDARPKMPTVLFLHHHVLPIGVRAMDRMMLGDSLALLNLLDNYANVRFVASGHVHLEHDQEYRGRRFVCTPSLCFQLDKTVQEIALDPVAPGYRVFRIQASGTVETFVRRLPGGKSFACL
ncbi:MAG: metallophosphoesterase family protein [Anaerolineae bacterium]|nr:metallophosphoesterase family protein [Anaerolineae bacterium]